MEGEISDRPQWPSTAVKIERERDGARDGAGACGGEEGAGCADEGFGHAQQRNRGSETESENGSSIAVPQQSDTSMSGGNRTIAVSNRSSRDKGHFVDSIYPYFGSPYGEAAVQSGGW